MKRQHHEPETRGRFARRLARETAVNALAILAAIFLALFLLGYIHP